MNIFVYDFDFNLLLVERNVISVRWSIYYNGVGNFEAHFPLSSGVLDVIMNNKYLVMSGNGQAAIVVGVRLGDDITVYGRTCNWLLEKRITPAIESTTGYAGEFAIGIVSAAFSDVDNFVLGDVVSGKSVTLEYNEQDTESAVRDCLKRSNLGYSLKFDLKNKKWVFEIFEGKEIDIIFSEAHRNSYNTKLSWDILDLANSGYYSLETEDGAVRTYIDNGSQMSGMYRWEAKLSGSGEAQALAELEGKNQKDEVSLYVNGVRFGKEYQLGDIARVQVIKGSYKTTRKKRIVGVEMVFSQSGSYEMPIFEEYAE